VGISGYQGRIIKEHNKRIFWQEPTIFPNIWQNLKSLLSFLRAFIKENIFEKRAYSEKFLSGEKLGESRINPLNHKFHCFDHKD